MSRISGDTHFPDHQAEDQPDVRQDHHVPTGVEAAYNRLRRVRRSFIQLSDTLDSTARSIEQHSIGPGHGGIMLTGPLVEEPVEDEALFSSLERLEQVERPLRNRERGGEARSTVGSLITPRRLPSHPANMTNFSHSRLFPRRTFLESQLARHRDINREDPNTALGRRVAAREAAGAGGAAAAPSTSTSADDELSNRTPLIDGGDPYMRLLRQQLLDLEDAEFVNREGAARGEDTTEQRRPAQLQTQVLAGGRVPLSPWRAAEARRLTGPRYSGGRMSQSDQSERLSLLSNFSVQNLPTPRSMTLNRPLLFDEPASYTEPASAPNQHPLGLEDIVEDGPLGRSYVVHRRLNADGEEHVHSINLEWGDEDARWLLPNGEFEQGVPPEPMFPRQGQGSQRFSSGNPVSDDDTSQATRTMDIHGDHNRRRGWARLDADGNEIPSDEEEELERTRTEYRMQALYRARASASAARGAFDTQGVSQEAGIRVGIFGDDSRPFYGSVMHSIESVDDDSYRYSRTRRWQPPSTSYVLPFCPEPLPTPLSEMVKPSRKQGEPTEGDYVVFVPKYASFAGR